jgi:hypothetical protein
MPEHSIPLTEWIVFALKVAAGLPVRMLVALFKCRGEIERILIAAVKRIGLANSGIWNVAYSPQYHESR